MGNGAAELLQSAMLFPARPRRRAADAVALLSALSAAGHPRRRAAGGVRPRSALLDKVGDSHASDRPLNPNDPTGDYVSSAELGALLAALPEHIYVLLDEALVHFQDAEEVDAAPAVGRGLPAPVGGAHVLQGRGACRAACGLRRGVGRRPARRRGAEPGRERPHPGGDRARAADRGRRRSPRRREVVLRERRFSRGAAARAGRRRGRLAGQLRLAARARDRRRCSGERAAPPGGDRRARRAAGAEDHVRAGVLNEAATARLVRAYAAVCDGAVNG